MSFSFIGTDCDLKVDIGFIVDSSGSISRRNFARLKAFLQAIIQKFEIGPEAARVAIIAYSSRVQVVLKFNDPANLNKDEVNNKIARIPHQRGLTFIDKALFTAEREVFTKEGGIRTNVPQVIFL